MSSTYLGTAPLKTATELVFDPKTGFASRETYAGPANSLNTLNATFKSLGLRTEMSQKAGKSYLDVFYVTLEANDFWELDTEYVEESIWRNLIVWIEATAAAAAVTRSGDPITPEQMVTLWKKETATALKGRATDDDGLPIEVISDKGVKLGNSIDGPLPSSFPYVKEFAPYEKALYEQLIMGHDSYETTRQVLTRTRSVPINFNRSAVAQALPIVYSTGRLVAHFQIPVAIATRLPTDPVVRPANTLWGWKQRKNTSRYEWGGRVAEVRSWTFAAWSTLTHFFDHELRTLVQPPALDATAVFPLLPDQDQ